MDIHVRRMASRFPSSERYRAKVDLRSLRRFWQSLGLQYSPSRNRRIGRRQALSLSFAWNGACQWDFVLTGEIRARRRVERNRESLPKAGKKHQAEACNIVLRKTL